MKPIAEKVLKSGLVDKHMAKLLERWGYLPEGSHSVVPDKDLFEKATREQLEEFAEELGEEADKQLRIRETSLELDKIKWPTSVRIFRKDTGYVSPIVQAVIDRMGRYYFRIQDVKEEWFVPGYYLEREMQADELILEKTILFIDDQAACIQVTTTSNK